MNSSGVASVKSLWLINREDTLRRTAGLLSSLGDQVMDATLIVWIAAVVAAGQSWAPLAVSGVLLSAAVPSLVVGPAAVVFVDRWDPRLTMLVMDALRSVMVGSLALVVASGILTRLSLLLAAYTVVFASSVCGQFFSPANMAVLRHIVGPNDMKRASALSQVSTSIVFIVGPPLAVPVLFGLGPALGLALNAFSFVASFSLILLMPIRSPGPRSTAETAGFFHEFAVGARFVTKHRAVSTVFISTALLGLAVGMIDPLQVFFVTANLHVPARLYGFLSAAIDTGNLVGCITIAMLVTRLMPARLYCASILATGLLMLIYARSGNVAFAFAMLILIGPVRAGFQTSTMPLIMQFTPQDVVGRVFALFGPVVILAILVSRLLGGVLASTTFHDFHARIASVTPRQYGCVLSYVLNPPATAAGRLAWQRSQPFSVLPVGAWMNFHSRDWLSPHKSTGGPAG